VNSSLLKSLLVERLAEAGHEAIRRYARARGDTDVPPWADLDTKGRNRARAVVVSLFTLADNRPDVDELLEAVDGGGDGE